jgi:hypothetical protein
MFIVPAPVFDDNFHPSTESPSSHHRDREYALSELRCFLYIAAACALFQTWVPSLTELVCPTEGRLRPRTIYGNRRPPARDALIHRRTGLEGAAAGEGKEEGRGDIHRPWEDVQVYPPSTGDVDMPLEGFY